MKTCVKCGISRPPSDFSPHPRTRDKLQSWCKACVREKARESYLKKKQAD